MEDNDVNLDLSLSDATDVVNRYIELGTGIKRPFSSDEVPLSGVVEKVQTVPGRDDVVDIVHACSDKDSNKDNDTLAELDIVFTYNQIVNIYQDAGWILFPETGLISKDKNGRYHVTMEIINCQQVEKILDRLN